MRYLTALAVASVLVQSVAPTAWIPRSPRVQRRNNNTPASQGFVTTGNGQFQLNGRPFFYVGTNVYWLMQLSDENIDLVMKNISAHNISVVRTYAFNDVFEIPTTGAWFQAFNPNGSITINKGINGLQRLDKVLQSAKANKLKVQLVLTNNWNPPRSSSNGNATKRAVTHPPGFLSNDYGGIDAYVRAHGQQHHDQFFTNETIINAFENYLTQLVPRFKDNTDLVGWELANDARCTSTLPQSGSCTTQTLTAWIARLSSFLKTLDPNHAVSSGTQGFFCVDCPKLFPRAPAPAVSPAPGQVRRATGPLTAKKLLARRRARFKRNGDTTKDPLASAAQKRARGEAIKWKYRGAAQKKRQVATQAVGPGFDGSAGVDTEDIINIPDIGFSTFQFFPDQNVYEPLDPNLNSFDNTIQTGIEWIQQQAASGATFGKPISLSGFGLVTQNNLPAFTPFNATQPFLDTNGSPTQAQLPQPTQLGVGIEQNQLPVSDAQQETAYSQWIQAAIDSGIAGITQYQWGQTNLVPQPPPPSGATTQQQTPFVPAIPPPQQQITPNDGYSAVSSGIQNILQAGANQQQIRNA